MRDLDEHFSKAILAQLFGFLVNVGILPLGIDISGTQRNLIFTTKSLPVAALESRTWHPKEFRCYSQEKEKNLNRQIFPLSPNNL